MSFLKSIPASGLESADPLLKNWKQESEAIHEDMDCLLKAGWPETAADRQVRRLQFMALIERRNVAARKLLQANDGTPPMGHRRTLEQAPAARSNAANDYALKVPPSSDRAPQPPVPPSSHQAPQPQVLPGSEPMMPDLSILISLEP